MRAGGLVARQEQSVLIITRKAGLQAHSLLPPPPAQAKDPSPGDESCPGMLCPQCLLGLKKRPEYC